MAIPRGRAHVTVIDGRRCVITPAQQRMARLLKDARLPFQTNVILEGYEVDVLVAGAVAVEIDGPIHADTAVRYRDDQKRRVLERAGYTVVHLANDAVWYSPNESLRTVHAAVTRAAMEPRPQLAPWQQRLKAVWRAEASTDPPR